MAVILSGTGSDGTRGAEAIKRAGGLVLAQEPNSAKFDGMPNSIIGSGNADHILRPDQMPEEIFEYIQELPIHVLNNGKIDERLLEEVFKMVYQESGHDFNYYKTPTIIRRIARRMLTHRLRRLEEYLSFIKSNPHEAQILGKEFLIGVTKFFRDSAAYEVLYNDVFPQIVSGKSEGEILKIWVSACSTGEEAYSLAILLDKYLHSKNKFLEFKIFATDIDANAIEVASRGVYPESVEKDITADVLKEYFTKEGNNYVVSSRIRKQIVFARHNIIKDPPFIKNDLTTCRNMLIYMNNVLQRKVMTTLHFSLNPDGFLFLGPSESPTALKDNLIEINSKWKVYRRNGTSRPQPADNFFRPLEALKNRQENRDRGVQTTKPSMSSLADDFRDVMAQEFGFAAFYIDSNYEIIESLGDFKKYLSLPEKKLHLNILKMVPPELSVALNTAIRKAMHDQKKVQVKSVRVKQKSKQRFITLTVRPGSPYLLVVLGEVKKEDIEAKAAVDYSTQDTEANKYIMDLEVELKQTRSDLQMAIEGLETANEELQSSNEELLSANEELQSSNEELQSLNEELHTLNTEHQLKIKELIELNDDLNNYFRSTEIGQVFLDNRMRIRKFNPAAVNLINLIETDLGRPISHISNNLQYDNLLNDIKYVIERNEKVEKEIQLASGKKTLMRILPYVRQDKKSDGVVISFVDISLLKDLDNIVKGVFNANNSAIMVFRRVDDKAAGPYEYKWVAGNYRANRLLGLESNEYIGKKLNQIFPDIEKNDTFLKLIRQLQQQSVVRTEHAFISGSYQSWFDVVALRMQDELLVVTLTDITDKKQSEEKLRRSYEELIHAKEKLSLLNEQLEDKITERTRQLSASIERFRLVSKATNEAIWDWNLVSGNTWWSDAYYQKFGIEKTAAAGTRDAWQKHIHPSDRKRVSDSLDHFIRSGNTNWSEEYDFSHADGHYVRVLDRAYILHDEEGVPYRLLGSMLDVTLLRQAQTEALYNIEQRKFMAESMPLIVWSASPTGEIDFLNQHFYNYSGLTNKSNLQKNWESIIHPDDIEELQSVWKESLNTKMDFSIELRLRRSDSQYYWHLLRARSKRDEAGSVVSWIGTSTDVHEQKTHRETLEEKVKERTRDLALSNEELEASNIELQQFASVASHDLKEPLRKIHMFSHLLKDKYHQQDGDPAAEYLNRIISSSARMTNLVNDLLTFSRLSINQLFRLTDMNMIVDEVLGDLELLIKEKDAEIKVGYLPQLEAIPGQMRQVFQNILTNALKFSKKNERAYITIESQCLDEKRFDSLPAEQGNYCMISITDNGIGFDEQYKDKIFTIFQRLHTKEKYEGTGIGLAITKKIIDKHNGIITARSEDGKGSCFQFILPIRQGQKKLMSSR
jgi:two-component system CheB/CheR fusion protein